MADEAIRRKIQAAITGYGEGINMAKKQIVVGHILRSFDLTKTILQESVEKVDSKISWKTV